MELQAMQTIQKVYNMLKKETQLSDTERAYIIGSLETLIGMYTDNTELPRIDSKQVGFFDKLKKGEF
jgi:hypothetical protein